MHRPDEPMTHLTSAICERLHGSEPMQASNSLPLTPAPSGRGTGARGDLVRAFAFGLAATWLAAASLAAADAPRPNILHIHADDHRADGLGALGNPALKTPHLDEVAQRGFVFTHCYTQGSMIGAVCLPSRTMLLTGRSWLRIPKRKAAAQGRLLPCRRL